GIVLVGAHRMVDLAFGQQRGGRSAFARHGVAAYDSVAPLPERVPRVVSTREFCAAVNRCTRRVHRNPVARSSPWAITSCFEARTGHTARILGTVVGEPG